MSAAEIIEQIKRLPPEEKRTVKEFVTAETSQALADSTVEYIPREDLARTANEIFKKHETLFPQTGAVKNDMRFLTVDDIHYLHQISIERFGGTLGVRDAGGLESAVFHPQNVAAYGDGDIFEVAAAYAFHIAEGQCFLDGNKRTAVAAALNFLANNGAHMAVEDPRLYDLMIGIAEKRYSKKDLAAYLRESSSPK